MLSLSSPALCLLCQILFQKVLQCMKFLCSSFKLFVCIDVIFSDRLLFWSDNVEESDIRSHCVIEMALMDGSKRRVVATESQPSHLNVLTSLY